MQSRVKKSDFVNAVGAAVGAIAKRNTIPILSHVRITGEPGGPLFITGTDQEIGVTVPCPAEVVAPINGTVDGGRILSVFRSLPDGDAEIEFQDNFYLLVSFGRSKIKVVGADPNDYPDVPAPPTSDIDEVAIPGDVMSQSIEKVGFAASTNSQMMHLNGLCLAPESGLLRFAATDGIARLSIYRTSIEVENFAPITVPVRALEIARKMSDLGGDLTVIAGAGTDNRRACWIKDGFGGTVFARLYEAEFPLDGMQRIFGDKFGDACVLNRESFIQALKRSSAIADMDVVRLRYSSDGVEVGAVSTMNGESSDYVDCSFGGEEFSTGMKSTHLIAALSAIDGEDVKIKFNSTKMHMISCMAPDGHASIVAPYILD